MFITISELPETTLVNLSVGEYIAQWNKRMASAIAEAKASGDEAADGFFYQTFWAEREGDFAHALDFVIAMEYDEFSDSYKERNGVRPRWVARPTTLAEMREICEQYLS